jgi:hypothetical protein
MRNSKDILLYTTFLIGFVIAFVYTFLKISHMPLYWPILAIGIIATLIFMFYAIIEVVNSGQIKTSEKIMWTICLIFLSNLTGFIYLLWGRKRILAA